MRNEIVAAIMTGGPHRFDPAKKVGGGFMADLTTAGIMSYAAPWRESIIRMPHLHGTIIYDELTKEACEALRAKNIDVFAMPVIGNYHGYDRRFIAFDQYMGEADFDRAFFTDINDMGILCDPFTWWDGMQLGKETILISEAESMLDNNVWADDWLKRLPQRYHHLTKRGTGRKFPNCANVGGYRPRLAKFFREWAAEIQSVYNELGPDKEFICDIFAMILLLMDCPEWRSSYATFPLWLGADAVTLRGHPSPFCHDRDDSLRKLGFESSL